MRYAYYPGCSLHGSAKEYGDSLRAVCGALRIELVEMKNWNCCGTVHVSSVDRLLSLRLAARNLAIAEEMGLDVVAPCTGCYKNLRTAYYALGTDVDLKAAVNRDLPRQLRVPPR